MKVALTNYAREDCEELCCRLGADRFFDKTFEAKKCMGLIKSLVEEKRHGLSGRAPLEEAGAPRQEGPDGSGTADRAAQRGRRLTGAASDSARDVVARLGAKPLAPESSSRRRPR